MADRQELDGSRIRGLITDDVVYAMMWTEKQRREEGKKESKQNPAMHRHAPPSYKKKKKKTRNPSINHPMPRKKTHRSTQLHTSKPTSTNHLIPPLASPTLRHAASHSLTTIYPTHTRSHVTLPRARRRRRREETPPPQRNQGRTETTAARVSVTALCMSCSVTNHAGRPAGCHACAPPSHLIASHRLVPLKKKRQRNETKRNELLVGRRRDRQATYPVSLCVIPSHPTHHNITTGSEARHVPPAHAQATPRQAKQGGWPPRCGCFVVQLVSVNSPLYTHTLSLSLPLSRGARGGDKGR